AGAGKVRSTCHRAEEDRRGVRADRNAPAAGVDVTVKSRRAAAGDDDATGVCHRTKDVGLASAEENGSRVAERSGGKRAQRADRAVVGKCTDEQRSVAADGAEVEQIGGELNRAAAQRKPT